MYSLSTRFSSACDRDHTRFVRPRVWLVSAPRDAVSQRVALFDDGLMNELLDCVAKTDGWRISTFPVSPCGSQLADVWAHTMASRKQHRGLKNFASLSQTFGVTMPGQWSPLEIHIVSLSVMRSMFRFAPEDECALLSKQIGNTHPRRALFASRWYRSPELEPEGTLTSADEDTYIRYFAPRSNQADETSSYVRDDFAD